MRAVAVRSAYFAVAVFLWFSAPAAQAARVFTVIDYPGSVFTDVRAVNNSGQVVGYASDDNVNYYSFLYTYSTGTYQQLPPAPRPSSALGINDAGVIVGSASGPAGALGFILSGTTYTYFSHPGWVNTYGRAINNAGIVTGYVDDGVSQSMGFIYDPATGVFTDIPFSGANSAVNIAQGINSAGQVVGNVRLFSNAAYPGSPAGHYGYLRQPSGATSLFRARIAGTDRQTRPRGITDDGRVIGFYLEVNGEFRGFYGQMSNLSGNSLLNAESLSVTPTALRTVAEGINNHGHIVGLFIEADGRTRGFIATEADPTPPVVTATVSGTAGSNGWYTGAVTVTWNVLDNESPVTSRTGCEAVTVSSDTDGTTFTCSATSAGGNTTVSKVIRIDSAPPAMSCSASPSLIWPPNHKLVAVNASATVTDALSGAGGFTLLSATSSEPDNGLGDGDTAGDIQGWTSGTSDLSGFFRAERSGNGSGRTYTLTYRGADAAGNTATCSATATVPHDKR